LDDERRHEATTTPEQLDASPQTAGVDAPHGRDEGHVQRSECPKPGDYEWNERREYEPAPDGLLPCHYANQSRTTHHAA
jgi:hypothetical protein